MPKETGWAIAGNLGLYTGWWLTRHEAIEHHVKAKNIWPTNDLEKVWRNCKREGDRAVKIEIKY